MSDAKKQCDMLQAETARLLRGEIAKLARLSKALGHKPLTDNVFEHTGISYISELMRGLAALRRAEPAPKAQKLDYDDPRAYSNEKLSEEIIGLVERGKEGSH